MERRRLQALIGLSMIVLGLVQAGSSGVADEWLFSLFGFLYAIIGVAYLLAEVYATAE